MRKIKLPKKPMRKNKLPKFKRVILGVTASIAAYKSADIIRRLQEKGYRVSVIMTRESEKFITALTLASLAGEKVHQDLFDDTDHAWHMSHITLVQEADVFLITPATANVIGKIANGLADDLLTCAAMATKAPILIAPAMNTDMYNNKVVQDNIARLKKIGVHFIEPITGKLACGTMGEGHLADIEDIVKSVIRLAK